MYKLFAFAQLSRSLACLNEPLSNATGLWKGGGIEREKRGCWLLGFAARKVGVYN